MIPSPASATPPRRGVAAETPETAMATVAKITEISSRSAKSFEDAITGGIARAAKTLRNIESAWVKEMRVEVKNGKVTAYQVNLLLTFVLEK
jgi:flavin-binding protein dodecin